MSDKRRGVEKFVAMLACPARVEAQADASKAIGALGMKPAAPNPRVQDPTHKETVMKHMFKALAAAAMTVAGVSAHADFVNTWDYTITTQWVTAGANAPVFTAGGGSQVVTSNLLSWGDPSGSLSQNPNGGRSGLEILGSPQNGALATNDLTPGLAATFKHINNPISGDYATLRNATVETTLVLQATDPAGSPLAPAVLTFRVDFAETPNSDGNCIPEATTVCDDVFVLVAGNLNQQFVYDNVTYYVSFLDLQGGPLTPLSPEACAVAGAPVNCLGFWTGESQSETIDFGLVITGQPLQVPEPGMLALTGLGLLAAVGASRRRRRQAA
jgi:hypothetical protein